MDFVVFVIGGECVCGWVFDGFDLVCRNGDIFY